MSLDFRRSQYFLQGCRWLVYASRKDSRWLFVAFARDEAQALKIGKQQGFRMDRTAFAVPEDRRCTSKKDVQGGVS